MSFLNFLGQYIALSWAWKKLFGKDEPTYNAGDGYVPPYLDPDNYSHQKGSSLSGGKWAGRQEYIDRMAYLDDELEEDELEELLDDEEFEMMLDDEYLDESLDDNDFENSYYDDGGSPR